MLRVPRGLTGAAFLHLALAVRTMSAGTCGRGLGPGPGPRERVEPREREAAEARRARVEVPPHPRRARGAAAAEPLSPAPLKTRAPSSAPTVSLPELRSLLASGRARLIDVRSREEAAAGTIPGALNIPGMGWREDAPVGGEETVRWGS